MTIVTDRFESLGVAECNSVGLPQLPLALIPHPLGGQKPDYVAGLAAGVLAAVRDGLSEGREHRAIPGQQEEAQARRLDISVTGADPWEAANERMLAEGMGDGLPVVPPTEQRVTAMLRYCDRPAGTVIGKVPPKWAVATIEDVAANAVMAGARPEYFPFILTAVEALLDPSFNLYGVQATTHPCSTLVILHGPLAAAIGANSGAGALGPGNRANATIGRAVRLAMLNLGGAVPGELDRATLGHPGKFTYCLAENEAESPWAPFAAAEHGLPAGASAVTVASGESPHNINDHGSTSGANLLITLASALAHAGHNNLYLRGDCFLLLGPEHAATLASDGYTRQSIREQIWREARVPAERISPEQLEHMTNGGGDAWTSEARRSIPMAPTPEDIHILVAGGPGKHSAFIPTFGISRTVTRQVVRQDGRPVTSLADLQ